MSENTHNTYNVHTQRFVNLWSEIFRPGTWASIFYFIFWNPPWTLFCLIWVLCTGIVSICSLVFPPLGYFICVGTVMSWRSLARFEIITTSFCTNPNNFINDTIAEIARKAAIYPITQVSSTETEFPGYIRFGVAFCYNEYTVNCFKYFVFHKMATLLLFIIAFPICLIMSLPPFTLFGFPMSCKWYREYGERLVIDSRSYLVPGWKPDDQSDVINQQSGEPREMKQNQGREPGREAE